MANAHKLQDQFEQWQCCVIIPTYNNAQTLSAVIDDVLRYTSHLLVINDGATDQTPDILSAYQNLTTITFAENKGKGIALREGFKAALDMGYTRAITLDSDGQHKASDLPNFFEVLEKHPKGLLVGARNMGQDSVPGTSSFGHRFSNFWYRVITGINLPDTQSGYRLYPLDIVNDIRFYTSRFEFEMEAIVRISWRTDEAYPVPIDVYYPPATERITHFRKVPDFTRITLVNILFVAIALLYIRPLKFLKGIKKKNWKELIRKEVYNSTDSNSRITYAVMVGLFMGISPLWGWQMILTVVLTSWLKLNRIIALTAAQISIPPAIPFILYASYATGGWLLGRPISLKFTNDLRFSVIKDELVQYVLGSFVLGFGVALLGGILTFILLALFRRKRIKQGV